MNEAKDKRSSGKEQQLSKDGSVRNSRNFRYRSRSRSQSNERAKNNLYLPKQLSKNNGRHTSLVKFQAAEKDDVSESESESESHSDNINSNR